MKTVVLLALGLSAVAAIPYDSQRIVGGSVTNIGQYPFAVAVLRGSGANFRHNCGGSILNNKSVLSAAHCFNANQPGNYRMRLGSTNANSGGVVHNTQRIFNHPSYNQFTYDSDISVIRSASTFSFNNNVRAGSIAGANYNLPDNAVVWAIGWGAISYAGAWSEQLRHVQIWVINQATCRNRYSELRYTITDNMLCSRWLDVGGRDQCTGDSGGPLIHNNIIVGVSSFGNQCGLPRYPGVNTRVSRYTNWILGNA